ncbi:putative ribonuclease H-like domain-containing protein, partial [Tanacetum coccineum]
TSDPSLSKSSKDSPNAGFKPSGEEEKIDAKHPKYKDSEVPNTEEPRVNQEYDKIYGCIDDLNMPNLEEIVYSDDDDEVGAEADINNLATIGPISPIPTTRVHKDHLLEQIIRYIHSAPQTRRMTNNVTEHVEPKKVWTLVDLPHDKRAIGTKWVYRNKKDDRGIVMDMKSAFLYGIIKDEVYVCQPLGFEDLEFPYKVYKVEKALYGLNQALRAWYDTLSTYLLENGFRRGTIDKTFFIKKDKDDAQEIPDEFYGLSS